MKFTFVSFFIFFQSVIKRSEQVMQILKKLDIMYCDIHNMIHYELDMAAADLVMGRR